MLEISPHGRQGPMYIIVHISVAADDMVMQEAIAPGVYKTVSQAALFFEVQDNMKVRSQSVAVSVQPPSMG